MIGPAADRNRPQDLVPFDQGVLTQESDRIEMTDRDHVLKAVERAVVYLDSVSPWPVVVPISPVPPPPECKAAPVSVVVPVEDLEHLSAASGGDGVFDQVVIADDADHVTVSIGVGVVAGNPSENVVIPEICQTQSLLLAATIPSTT